VETRNGASKTTCEIDDKNQIEEQFPYLQAFHPTPGERVQEITAGEQFEPQNLESFDPVTQELYRLLPAMIHTPHEQKSTNMSKKKQATVSTHCRLWTQQRASPFGAASKKQSRKW
jgi:hypothetical protein